MSMKEFLEKMAVTCNGIFDQLGERIFKGTYDAKKVKELERELGTCEKFLDTYEKLGSSFPMCRKTIESGRRHLEKLMTGSSR